MKKNSGAIRKGLRKNSEDYTAVHHFSSVNIYIYIYLFIDTFKIIVIS